MSERIDIINSWLEYAAQRYVFVKYSAVYFEIAKWVFYLLFLEFLFRYIMTLYKIVRKSYQPNPLTVHIFALRERSGTTERCRVPTAALMGEVLFKGFLEVLYLLILSTLWVLWLPISVIMSVIFRDPIGLFNYEHVRRKRRTDRNNGGGMNSKNHPIDNQEDAKGGDNDVGYDGDVVVEEYSSSS
jgi:hypothetical protein